jgi:hypothetical protein
MNERRTGSEASAISHQPLAMSHQRAAMWPLASGSCKVSPPGCVACSGATSAALGIRLLQSWVILRFIDLLGLRDVLLN